MIVHHESAEQSQKTAQGKVINPAGAIEWDLKTAVSTSFGLTTREIQALQAYHQSTNINTARALAVKQYMQSGKTCGAIVRALRGSYGERMVKGDHAALSRLKKGI